MSKPFTPPATCTFQCVGSYLEPLEVFCGCYQECQMAEKGVAVDADLPPYDDPFGELTPEEEAALKADLEAHRAARRAAGLCEDCGAPTTPEGCEACAWADSYKPEECGYYDESDPEA